MSSTRIADIRALEILDSRGSPTVTLTLGDGTQVPSAVPPGASSSWASL